MTNFVKQLLTGVHVGLKQLLTGVHVGLRSSTHLFNFQQTTAQLVNGPFTQLCKLHLQNNTVAWRNQSNIHQTVCKHGPVE